VRFCCGARTLEFTRVGIVTSNSVRTAISEMESLIILLVLAELLASKLFESGRSVYTLIKRREGTENITFGILNDQAKPMVFTFEVNERWRALMGWDPLRDVWVDEEFLNTK